MDAVVLPPPLPRAEVAGHTVLRLWPELLILLLAAALRLVLLDLKPAHFDEGINGYFVDQMTHNGFYHYDPTNFHGPLHFYVLFLFQTLLGRHVWVLRLPVALCSTACVALTLAYRRYFSVTTCRLAALAMAVSPAMIFYGRYAIHETSLLLALMGTVWGLLGMWQRGDRRDLWVAIAGVTGMILTKETYVIHLVALGLAVPVTMVVEKLWPSSERRPAQQRWDRRDLWKALALSGGTLLFFYSGNLLDWSSLFPPPAEGKWALPSVISAFDFWTHTGTGGNGHDKDWSYWLTLRPFHLRDLLRMCPGLFPRYEWPAFLGLCLSPLVLWRRATRSLRWVVIAGGGTLVAYSIIRYKTPWCIVVLLWPFLFLFGFVIEAAAQRLHRWVAWSLAGVLLAHSTAQAVRLNFFDYTDADEPYVYVQTMNDIRKLLDPLHLLAAEDSINYHLKGWLLFTSGEDHPLPWLLADFPHAGFLTETSPAREMDADFLLIQDPFVSDVEDRLHERYFREVFTLRGNSDVTGNLYFRASTFARLFPGRVPEFEPFSAPLKEKATPAAGSPEPAPAQ